MSVLAALDATRICARWSEPLADPAAWALPMADLPARATAPRPAAEARTADYSWWSLARNPHAILVTGMVGTVLVKDAVVRALAPSMAGAVTSG